MPRAQADQTAITEVQRAEMHRIEHDFLPGDHKDVAELHSTLSIERVRTVLLPVWIASFEHAGQTHHVYVNGQTGTVTGHVPRSGLKIAFAVLLTLAFVVTAWYLLAEALS